MCNIIPASKGTPHFQSSAHNVAPGDLYVDKTLDDMRNDMPRGHYSIHIERADRDWGKCYVRFHNIQPRDDLHDGE